MVKRSLLVGLVLAASTAFAGSDPYQTALDLYDGAQYAKAIPLFEQAYAANKSPKVLYGLAMAEYKAGDYAAALPHYRLYLDSNPSAEGRQDTLNYMMDCWVKLPAGTQVGRNSGVPFYKSVGALGVYTGVISAGVGVAFMWKASSTRDAAKDAQFADDFDSKLQDATGQRRIGITLMVTGGLLAAGGLTYYFVTRPTEKPSTTVALTPTSIWVARAF